MPAACTLAGVTASSRASDQPGPAWLRTFDSRSARSVYRANFWNLMRLGIRLSAPRRRFLSSS